MTKISKKNQVATQSVLSNHLTRRSFLVTASTVLAGVSLTGPVYASTTLKWAHVYEANSPYHKAVLWAADEVKKQTEGRVIINAYPASSLGKEAELNEALEFGTVDIIYTGDIFAGQTYAPMKLSAFPFVIRNYNHWKAYRDSDLFKEISNGYEKKTGNQITAYTYYGARHVTSNKPIHSPSDMNGMKIRVPNAPLYFMFPKSVKANPTPLAFSEVYLALQQGVVDAQENPLPTIKFKKFYEVQKYITLTGHMTNSIITIMSNNIRGKISQTDYDKLVKVTGQAAERASDQINEAELTLAQWFTKQGVTVNKIDRHPFKEAIKPYLIPEDNGFTAEQLSRLEAL